ncbi:T9SS type A sorting domain-containing protein [bacterium]|nr:T9SS type A sorting domain-containing protein [bacterium]
MKRLNGFELLSRILLAFQNHLKRVGFAVLLLAHIVANAQVLDTLWTTNSTGIAFSVEEAIATPDGGYLLVGNDHGIPAQAYFYKMNAFGQQEWWRDYGGEESFDYLYDVEICEDGGYIAVGRRFDWPEIPDPSGFIVRTDAFGDTLWTTTFLHDSLRLGFFAIVRIETGWMIGGTMSSRDSQRGGPWLALLGDDGNLIPVYEDYDFTHVQSLWRCVRQEDRIVFSGTRFYDDSMDSTNVFLSAFSLVGAPLWERDFRLSRYSDSHDLTLTPSGFLLTAGIGDQYIWGPRDMWFIKTDFEGNMVWSTTMRGPHSDLIEVTLPDSNDNFVAIGWRGSVGVETMADFFAAGLDSNGDSLWYHAFEFPNRELGGGGAIASDGSYMLFGDQRTRNDESSLGLYTLCAVPHRTDLLNPRVPLRFDVSLSGYPNPFNSLVHIRFELPSIIRTKVALFDIRGRETRLITDGILSAGYHSILLDASTLSSGPYYVRLTAGSVSKVQNLIVVK